MTKMNYKLEDKMTSLRVISITVILYVLGYFLKVSVLLNSALESRITNELIRASASIFTGIVFSTALFLISFHKDKYKTPYIVAVSDAIILLIVFDVTNAQTKSDLFTLVFISVFMAFIGFNLIGSFVEKYKESKSENERSLSEILTLKTTHQQELNELEQILSERKRTTCRYCGKYHETVNSLNAHIGKCKENPKNKTLKDVV